MWLKNCDLMQMVNVALEARLDITKIKFINIPLTIVGGGYVICDLVPRFTAFTVRKTIRYLKITQECLG